MERPKSYKTKNQRILEEYIETLGDTHFTANDAVMHLKGRGEAISVATIYRQLEKMVLAGRLRKYSLGDMDGACFQKVKDTGECREHYHLKCTKCGTVIHLQCKEVDDFWKHLYEEHHFLIEPGNTVYYGVCKSCQ